MGSLGFMVDDEFQPGSKKLKLSRKILNDCGEVNNVLVPKKPRSAIKKRGREVITPPSPISKEQRLGSNGVGNKSKLMKKKGRISKDEKEVAETLNALADMFFDAANTIKPVLDDEPCRTTGPATIQEHDCSNAADEDSGIPSQAVNLKDLTFNGKSDFSGAQSDSSRTNRVNGRVNVVLSGFSIEHVRAPGFQYGKNYYSKDEQSCMGFYQSSICGKLSSSKQVSPLRSPSNRLPAWLEKAKCSIQLPVNDNKATSQKYNHKNVAGLNSCWKRCAAHVHISRLVNVMQTSHTKVALFEKPTPGVVFFNGNTHSGDSAEIQNAILLHQKLIQDQPHLPSKTSVLTSSTKQSSNFLSLNVGDCDMNNHSMVPFLTPRVGGGQMSSVPQQL